MSETQIKPGANPAGTLRVIESKADKASVQAAEKLENLAAQARRGEVVGFHGITENANGTYTVHCTNGLSRLQAAGALRDAAIARLGFAIRDDA